MLRLYSYWRSSAAYRVRIALKLKTLDYELLPVHLLRDGGEQHAEAYRKLNPQQLVPLLVDDQFRLSQSLAIFQYLEERWPEPHLLPQDLHERAHMWAFCQAIACDIHPLNNLRVLQYLGKTFKATDADKDTWYRYWVIEGLRALEITLGERPQSAYCFGDVPTYADCCLVPQMYNAERYGVAVSELPRLLAITQRCREHPAFIAAHPDQQPDAQKN